MFATEPSRNAFTTSESNMPLLDVPAMTRPILDNFDMHVNNLIRFLRDRLQCYLIYEGPTDIQQHILQRTMYACSVFYKPKKILKDVFPVMIGSRLDKAIRHENVKCFREPFDMSIVTTNFPFQELDIGTGFFLICGFLRHLPYFYTNDPTNTHVIQRKIVRVYSYNAMDRGKELSFYVADTTTTTTTTAAATTTKNNNKNNKRKCGDVVVVHNDGSETDDDPYFFNHCPFPVNLTAYMNMLFREDSFDIDHLGNKMVTSQGHICVKLFIKYCFVPLLENDWKLAKSRVILVNESLKSGFLLHVLSRKTVYYKETKSAGKMTSEPHESCHREIGANGEVFMEKNIGCYREVSNQTYPLNPFLLYVIVRQISKKVKNSTVNSFHPSYLHFLCILGIFETKNVGRTTMMVRDTIVSTCDDLDSVYHDGAPNEKFWKMLQLEPELESRYYVVVNEACIPVTEKSFNNLDLFKLKFHFKTIECYQKRNFKIIRYKMGIIMKKLPQMDIWVTPYDASYWLWKLFQIENSAGRVFSNITSYIVDLNRFFNHTAFPKNILAFNALKNSVLATNPKYALYFMDSISTYFRKPTSDHKVLSTPKDDGISKHFVLMMPQPVVTYMSFKGCTQEDCIVKRKSYHSFDCCRFYTLRLKVEADATASTVTTKSWVKFYPVRGHEDPESDLLGTLTSGEPINVEPFSIHINLDKISQYEYRIHFNKPPFRVVQHSITGDKLLISVEQKHICNTGDKLCSLHGQKGVVRVMDQMPKLDDDNVEPDLIVNPYCMFRTTPGQILEAIHLGGGKDSTCVRNSSGVLIKDAKAFYGKTFYFSVVYWANEHLYAPTKCVLDRVTHQPVKGRSRKGGMKLGNMEVNALRGNGIASAFEEKFFEHGDRVCIEPTVSIPKSVNVVVEDAKCYKYLLEYETRPSVEMEYKEQEGTIVTQVSFEPSVEME